MNFHKYHALGNTYLVIETEEPLSITQIRTLCNPHYGIGADGILIDVPFTEHHTFQVTIYNPDGSEAEKSGNGLRIFARYLWDQLYVADEPFEIQTAGGPVTAQLSDNGRAIHLNMGHVTFYHRTTRINGHGGQLEDTLTINGHPLTICVADIGNPHCVVLCAEISADLAHSLGPHIETHSRFPHRTNVQFMKIIDPHNIQIEIWERGAGYTLASGSSSCAAAAVAHKLGRCANNITVHMPGGHLHVTLNDDYTASLTGPVTKICSGTIELEQLIPTSQTIQL